MFVKLNVGEIETMFVDDTGATLTLLSSQINNVLIPIDKFYLNEIKTVCGNKLKLRGKISLSLRFCPTKLQYEAVVTDLEIDGILGLDLKRHNCLIGVKNGLLCIGNF